MMSFLRDVIFANKLDVDNRLDNPLVTFTIDTSSFWNTNISGGGGDIKSCSLIPPMFDFYTQVVILLIIQTIVAAILALLMYTFILLPRHHSTEKMSDSNTNKSSAHLLWGYGVILPILLYEPIILIEYLGIKSAGLRMAILALPITGSFRCFEAMYGFTPPPAMKNRSNFILYNSCLFGLDFDPESGEPKHTSWKFLQQKLIKIAKDFIYCSLLLSLLSPYDYALFETELDAHSMDHSLWQLFSWQHLVNNYLMALLLSFSLSQSTRGLSILYNIVYRCETYEVVLNPMFESQSPSDFWGKRWNILVHHGLKNGVYRPVRKHFSSRYIAVLAVFLASGVLHEYVNMIIFSNPHVSFKWKQVLFFGWNGILIVLEYKLGGWILFQWMKRYLPQYFITVLVVSCALPLAHLFTGDYIVGGYFDSVRAAEPLIVCSSVL